MEQPPFILARVANKRDGKHYKVFMFDWPSNAYVPHMKLMFSYQDGAEQLKRSIAAHEALREATAPALRQRLKTNEKAPTEA